ncbi:MAG: hypothetical protein K2X77_33070, partial [Candidatus Obscuribacterales bacterium]|nr:hypothetical protein [Candidatus Obscuribacterales bacterium]
TPTFLLRNDRPLCSGLGGHLRPEYAPSTKTSNNEPNSNGSSSSSTQNKISQIRKLPAGKNRVEQILGLVHEMDPREYNGLVDTLTIEEQDELTQRLLKIRKKKNEKQKGKSSWYLTIPEDEDRSAGSIILWWEARRVPFNLMVGTVGLISTLAIMLFAHADPSLFLHTLGPILVYGLCANLCYTGGWIAELIAKRTWAEKAQYFGPIALGLGTAFSVLLTLLPLVFVALFYLMRLIGMGL